MKTRLVNLAWSLLLVFLLGQGASSQVQFSVPINLQIGTSSDVLNVGVSGDGPGGTITDNTYGLDEGVAFGAYEEGSAPPEILMETESSLRIFPVRP